MGEERVKEGGRLGEEEGWIQGEWGEGRQGRRGGGNEEAQVEGWRERYE